MSSTSMSDLFREALGQSLETPQEPKKEKSCVNRDFSILRPRGVEQPLRRNMPGDKYQKFLDKYSDLERFLDGFDSVDLTYYFREKAKEAGVKYHISNMKRDIGIFKKLLDTYTPPEIALMIEFIFFSNQDYLDTSITQPTVLASNFVNTIYPDSQKWAKDEYVPGITKREKKAKLNIKKREWKNKPTNESAKIGKW